MEVSKTNNTMKKLIIFAALLTGLASCTNIETKVLTVQRIDGKVQEIRSNVSMNVKGDSIMICDVYCSGIGSRTNFYGNLGTETPEDYFNSDSVGIYSKHYEPAVVLKVEVD
jgi:hypothetical protein